MGRVYQLHEPTMPELEAGARWLRDLDDGRGLVPFEHDRDISPANIARAHMTTIAQTPSWRARDRLTAAPWPADDDTLAWAGLGASHAFEPTYPRLLPTDQRPHALAYTAAYAAVLEAYMETPPTEPTDETGIADAIESHTTPLTEAGDPHSLAWSSEIGQIAGAVARAQTHMGDLVASHKAKVKMKNGGEYEYSFANIADALKACLRAFNDQSCAVLQPVTTFKGGVEVRTVIIHESGQWLRAGILTLPSGNDAQAIGSAITYARRYQLLGMVGLAPGDDDGAAATAATRGQKTQQRPARRQDRVGCKPETANVIDTLCTQIAMLADMESGLPILRHAYNETGHAYRADLHCGGDLTGPEAIAVHRWLETDLEKYGNDDNQAAGAP